MVAGDVDDDGRADLFVANDLSPNLLNRNQGQGLFREMALPAGVAVAADGKVRGGMGTELADYDGDGRLDLVVTNFEFEGLSLFRNLGDGLFADASYESALAVATLPFVGFGVVFLDADNDGDLDLAIANGHVLDNPEAFPRVVSPRPAQPADASTMAAAAFATPVRWPDPASRSRRSAAHWPPATWTTTATWTCWW